MKKNLISIAILALLIVNIVLTAIMMISVASTNKKTAALVTDIATAISLDLSTGEENEEGAEAISMSDVVTLTISDMTIPLKRGEDGKDHYALISVALLMNSQHEDYEKYGADVANKTDLIKGQINEAVSQFTIDEANANPQLLKQEILKKVQALYNSNFIYDVTLSSTLYQ